MDDSTRNPIAIVGIGCRFPGGAGSPDEFWRMLSGGVDAITEIPPDRIDLDALYDPDPAAHGKIYTRWGGFIDGIDAFDADFFGIAPREARRMDPQQRLLLEVVWEALEDGGQPPGLLAATTAGVFIGIASHDYTDIQDLQRNRHRIDAHVNAGGAACIAANRISYVLDLRGPSLAVDTACSSSLTAVHLACRSITSGECDLAIVGGVNVLLAAEPTIGFCRATMLSRDGRCHTFDARANGYVRGEGAGAVILKPLARAQADGDSIYAVIRGSAINQDGRTPGISLPSAAGQAEMLRQALRDAGVSPFAVQYVEAHGTGTVAGDPVEAEAIGSVFGTGRGEGDYCVIGSVKTNIGHLEAGAGIAGLIKAALCLQHRQIPPSLNFQEPNPAISFEGLRLRVPTALEPWPEPERPAMAAVNSFGFGGANASVVLSESPPVEVGYRQDEAAREQVLILSARSHDALRDLAGRHARYIAEMDPRFLRDICYTAAVRRSHHEHRLAVVADAREEVVDLLEAYCAGDERAGLVAGRSPRNLLPKLAFVFTGMGPQWWKMGRQLLREEDVFRSTLEKMDALLRPIAGWSLLEELEADEATSRITETYLAHLANFAIQIGLASVWRSWGIVPDVVVGHSSGEMAAACVAGALSLPDALLLAYHRGRLQHRTSGTGRMLAAGISPAEAQGLIAGLEDRVSVAAFNGPRSVTLSGDADALERIASQLAARQCFHRFLSVAVPYHGPQMETLHEDLLAALGELRPQPVSIPFISEVTANYAAGTELDAAYWWRNVREPVRFAAAIDRLAGDGCELFVEIGPHPVLAAAVTECFAERGGTATVLPSLRRGEDERRVMLTSLASLHVRGRRVEWSHVYPSGVCVRLPTYPWQRERHWFETDLGTKSALPQPVGTDSGHPLLGRRLRAPHPVWEVQLGDDRLRFLEDHVVQDSVVFPGAGYIEMMLAAAQQVLGDKPIAVERVAFHKLLFVPDNRAASLQILYDPGKSTAEIHAAFGTDDVSWSLHAAGTLRPLPTVAAEESSRIDEIRSRCNTQVDVDALYASFERKGLRYGAAFRGIRELWRGEREALARIAVDPTVESGANESRGHCALLDAAFQVLASAAWDGEHESGAPMVPVSVARVESFGPPGKACWSHAVLTHREPDAVEGEVRLIDDSGRVLLSCKGLRVRAIAGRKSADIHQWLYELSWEEAPLPQSAHPPARRLPAPMLIVGEVRDASKRLEKTMEIGSYYEQVEPALHRMALHFARGALRQLGWESELRNRDPSTVADELGVIRRQVRFFTHLLNLLEESHAEESPDLVPDRLAALILQDHPDYSAEFELLQRSGSNLADVLRGETDPRDLLFGDSFAALSRLYRDSPICRYCNRLAAEVLAVASRRPEGSAPLRILEIGAGTGALTSALLPHLKHGTADYLFTDVSNYFLARAREEFRDRPEVRYGLFDIEIDPAAQQLAPGSFDVVVGANVVHATADLRLTLSNLRRLLGPGGLLLLVEVTRKELWFDMIFGPLEGWWRFNDHDLRPAHPLLQAEEWPGPLVDAGFDDVAVLSDPPRVRGTLESVILARAPVSASPVSARRKWLLFADRRGVGPRVAAAIRKRGDDCVVAQVGEGFLRRSSGEFEASAARDDIFRLVEALNVEGSLSGVVHLWSLDAPHADHASAADMMMAQQLGCESVLHLAQALELSTARPEMWLVTSGSQAVDGDAVPGIAQAPLWGLGRVLRNEQPEYHPRLVDLGPQSSSEEIDALVEELYSRSSAEEIALRDHKRFVRRLRRADPAAVRHEERTVSVSPDASTFRLEIVTPGALDSLALREASCPSPAPGHVLIRILAVGFNFRDVMLALGMLPAQIAVADVVSGAPHIECSGVILRCGEGVTEFRAGDEVIALAVGWPGSHATAREELVVRKPENLSFEEAASIPGIYLTARYGLIDLGRMSAGERVLIHSGSGGVGHAAIQLARRAEVEIFTTAGTPEKRAYLQTLGIEHVMDSRSLWWADEVLERTGGSGVDVILNSLAGEAISKGLQVLRPFGRFIEIGKRDIYEDSLLGLSPFSKNIAFFSLDLVRLGNERPQTAGAMLRDIVAQVAGGILAPPLRTDFDIAESEHAYRLLATARHIGKVVLTVRKPEYAVRTTAEHALFSPDATYLITGGLGGFGLAVAEWMVRKGARHVVLMSRSGKPKDSEHLLRRLEASEATVQIVRGDVAREEDVAGALACITAGMPPLRGIMHLAMVLDDALLGELDSERFRAVLRPKIEGAWNLHRLTLGHRLDHFVLFSSISSVVGQPMQGNYAAANNFLDSLAAFRRGLGLPGVAISWGTVSEVGYVARHEGIQHHLSRLGIGSFTPGESQTALEAALRWKRPHLVAARLEWSLLEKWNRTAGESSENGAGPDTAGVHSSKSTMGKPADLLDRLRKTAIEERLTFLEGHVLQRLSKVLGTTPQRVDPERPLTEMGLDSLLAVELLTTLKLDFNVQIPVVKLLQGITVRELTHLVMGNLGLDVLAEPGDGAPSFADRMKIRAEIVAAESTSRLSFEQRRFWYQEQVAEGNPTHHLFAAARLTGLLDLVAMKRAFEEVVRRHEALRGEIKVEEGEPLQAFVPPMPVPLPLLDLRHLAAGERESELQRRATAEIRKPFDLSSPPLLRCLLVRLDEREHVLLFVVHHIAADAWAMTRLAQEVMALYDASLRGRPPQLGLKSTHYADYVRWQQSVLTERMASEQLEYWKHQLEGADAETNVPTDRPRSRRPSLRGRRLAFELSGELSNALSELSRREGVTLFMTLLAAFQTLLLRHSGNSDISIATPVDMRNGPEAKDLVGCCMNTVVLRTDLGGDPTFRELLRRARETTLGAFTHRDVPFEGVVEALQPRREMGRPQLFQAMLIVHNLKWPKLEMEGLIVEPLQVQSDAALCDLTLLVDVGDRLRGTLEYDLDLFDESSVSRMLDHLVILLESVVCDRDRRLSELPLMSDAERYRMLSEGNQTATDFGDSTSLHQLLEGQVERTPRAVAVVFGEERLSYRDLDARSGRLATRLRGLGVGPDVVVGVYAWPSPYMVTGVIGILKAGGAFLPLDPASPRERVEFMIRDACVSVVLTTRDLAVTIPDETARVVLLDEEAGELPVNGEGDPSSKVNGDDLAYVLYTSGSTGEPKGVMISHRAICNQVRARQAAFPLTPADVVLLRTPSGFDPSIWEVFGPLSVGASLIVPLPSDVRDSAGLIRMISGYQVTVLQTTPSLLDVLLDEPGLEACRSLRTVFCGGEPLRADLRDRFFHHFPEAQLHNLYGPTEAAIDATSWTCRAEDESSVVPIGNPIANVQVYLLDRHLEPVPLGMPGELCIGGAGLARGYLNRPSLTAEKFIPQPFGDAPGARLYRTGDLARRRSDGSIEFLGRLDEQIKIRGYRVEPGEIEAVLMRHPSVRDTVVICGQDRSGNRLLIAHVVTEAGQDIDTDALRALAGDVLPEYMVPSQFAITESLPRLPNGKVHRRLLAETAQPGQGYRKIPVGPRNELEMQITQIWEEFLPSPVGVTDNFFELGGHSLMAMRLISRIRKVFGRDLPLESLVGKGTVEHLAHLLDGQPESRPAITQALMET